MPGLIIDKVGGGSSIPSIENSFSELQSLKNNSKLIVGSKYILADYLHKYLIWGSQTGGIVNNDTVSSTPYDYYVMLESGTWLPTGTKLTVTSLPDWYTGSVQVGAIGSVAIGYAGPTYRLSGLPPINGMGLSYEFPNYNNPYIHNKTIKERFSSPLTGTITSIEGVNVITGTDTLFTSELEVGDTIKYIVDEDYGYDRVIAEIVSDTELIITDIVLIEDIATDVVFEKITFGRDIMRSSGILNTEVHNGEAYSGMTAEENQPPQTEKLILTAISPDSFSTKAESLTYVGDVVEFIFEDSEIKNRAGEVLDTRPGLIIHRENVELNISMNVDWRAQRFRRFAITDKQFEKLRNIHDVYKADSGSQVYHLGGINSKSYSKEVNRYLMTDVENGFSLTDFRVSYDEDANIFENGFVLPQTVEDSGAWEGTITNGNYDSLAAGMPANSFSGYYSLNFNEIKCKDFTVLPLIDNQPSSKVKKIKVKDLINTIFLDKNRGMGSSDDIDIEADHLRKCSFMTGGKISSTGIIDRFNSIESFNIKNTGRLAIITNFSELDLDNAGDIVFSQFGGAWYYPINFIGYSTWKVTQGSFVCTTIFGIGNSSQDNANVLSGTICKDVLFKYMNLASNQISIIGSLFCLANHEDAGYGGNIWFQRAASYGNIFDLHIGFQDRSGDMFWLAGAVRDKHIILDKKSKALYSQEITDGQMMLTEVSKSLKSVDLSVLLSVDNEAPEIGTDVIFTITAENNPGNPATDVVVNSLLPAGFTFVSDDAAGNYDPVTGLWAIGNLAVTAIEVINITATVEAEGLYQVDATIAANEKENTPLDNTASITLEPTESII